MSHFPKPFWRPKRGRWYVQIDGKHVNLGPDETEAFRRYHQVMAERGNAAPIIVSTDSDPALSAILDEFLDWCLKHRERRTYDTYMERIQSFLDAMPDKNLAAKDLRPFHLQRWVDAHPTWNPGMKRGRLQAVQRALNWAVKQGRIDKSPVAFMEKPPAGKRENVISPELYQKLLSFPVSNQFRELITVTWETGCRPQEIWRVEARHLDVEGKRWVFPTRESKGNRKIRIVYLTDNALAICQRLIKLHRSGPIFRNTEGTPWNRRSCNSVFCRLKDRLGKKYALVDFRHSFVQ